MYEALRTREGDREVEVMAMNWVERLENQYERAGRREGRKEGKREGRIEGIRQVLLRLLALRFGPLPDAVRRRVEEISSVARLNRLAEKVVVAGSLEEMGLG